MDLELFPLLVGMGVGALFGARGKNAMKSMAKGYFALMDRAKEWSASAREDMRDAIEEARYEREREQRAEISNGRREESAQAQEEPEERRPRTARRRSTTAAAKTGETKARATRGRQTRARKEEQPEEQRMAA